jgi:hypothetical protein
MNEGDDFPKEPAEARFVEGRDYYFEDGLMVLKREFLLRRGHCCGSGCRHCPYETDVRERSE